MGIKEDWKKRAVSGLMVLAMVLSLLPTTIFAADTRSATDNAIKNGSFEQPEFGDRKSPQWPADQVPDWHTTAFEQKIEFGSTRQNGTVPHISGKPDLQDGGYQFVELNAEEESTLYQDATTVGGNVYEWGLSHRGRSGVDQMAVIIGPKQDVDPAKPSKGDRDQFMRMTDWVRQHASEMGVVIPDRGCTQKITVYSKKFAANGEFRNDVGDAFSASPSDVYTEKWNVWIIGTGNSAWGNYGTNSSDYAARKLAYSCRYAVPDGQTETVFAFCSYSAAGGKKTLGNLIDNIHFSLYQTLSIRASGGGTGSLTVSADGKDSTTQVSGSEAKETLAADGSTITVQAVEPDENTTFVGAYVTLQTQNGLERMFVSAEKWTKSGNTYTYQHHVEEPADIGLVFIKSPTVMYDANGGQEYVYEPGATEPKNTVSFAEDTRRTEYTSHAALAPAGCEDTWRFQGWLLARSKTLLPAEHTVTYDKNTDTLTFTGNGSESGSAKGGATLIAQWKWRQRFITASRVKGTDGTVSSDFQVNADCGTVEIVDGTSEPVESNPAATDYFASASERVTVRAAAKTGYEFIGWYQQIDGDKYERVSNEAEYSYTVNSGSVQTVYARFAPTHTVTYKWTNNLDECPTEANLAAAGKELPAAATVMDGDTYLISTEYTANVTSIPGTKQEKGVTVYGEWTFSGWRDEQNQIREVNLVNIRGNRTLTGYWTFKPNTRFTLTYRSAGENCWTPSGLAAPAAEKQYFRTEPVTAAGEPSYKQGELYVNPDLTLKGVWTFGGWKRSDTEDTVAASGEFNMPGNDVTLTGQWSFVPDTYTVSYDIGDGTGTAPESHDSYDYSVLEKKGGCTKQSGIPFGASITLRKFTGKAPEGTYFAGWSIVKPTSDNLDTIQTQGPGAEVDDKMLEASEAADHHVTLYAVYKPVGTATVEFDAAPADGGTVSLHSGSFAVEGNTIKSGEFVSVAKAKDGWHFVGWYAETVSDETTVTEGLSDDGLTLTVTAKMMADKLGLFPEKKGQNETPSMKVRYIAVFEPNMFTVQFNANGGEKSMNNQTFGGANSPRNLTKNAFTKVGYEFAGWAEYPDGTGTIYRDGALFENVTTYQGGQINNGNTITLYAQWKPLPDVIITYTAYPDSLGSVALNPKENEAVVENDLAVQSEIIYEKANPETGKIVGATATAGSGSVFAGWYNGLTREKVCESETFTPQQQGGRYVSASYVAYFRPYRYTLHYDPNGGAGAMNDQIFQHGQILPLNDCTYSREGYDFMGWSTSENNVKEFDNKAEVSFSSLLQTGDEPKDNAEATLYAVWKEQSVTLSYESNDADLGSVSKESETVAAVTGTAHGSTAQAKSGARFDGWYSADGTLLSTELTFVPTKADGVIWQGTTYYARFSAQRRPSTPSTPEKPDDTKTTLAPIPAMLNGEDHYAYLAGYEDGTVRPNQSISRAEVATVLFRLLKDDVRTQNLTKDNAYSDVSDTAWYAAAVSTLSKMGVISGYPDGTFRPNAPITRAEFAAMIARFDETAEAVDTPFTDISGHWAENAIGKAYSNGWVEGSSKTAFCPESNLTRAETATLLNRVLHRLPETESDLLADQIVWPDNPETFWGYLAMQEATNSHEYEHKADGVHETQTAKRENRDWSKEFEQ